MDRHRIHPPANQAITHRLSLADRGGPAVELVVPRAPEPAPAASNKMLRSQKSAPFHIGNPPLVDGLRPSTVTPAQSESEGLVQDRFEAAPEAEVSPQRLAETLRIYRWQLAREAVSDLSSMERASDESGRAEVRVHLQSGQITFSLARSSGHMRLDEEALRRVAQASERVVMPAMLADLRRRTFRLIVDFPAERVSKAHPDVLLPQPD